MRVYIETTVWSFALADDPPFMTQVALEFFEQCRNGMFSPLISALVPKELGNASEPKRSQLFDLVKDIQPELIPFTSRTESPARVFLEHRAVPAGKPEDAGHVAAAFAGGAEALVTWNFKHIASTRRADRFNAIALLQGLDRRLIITTPGELLDA